MPKSQVRKKKVYTPPTDIRPATTAASRSRARLAAGHGGRADRLRHRLAGGLLPVRAAVPGRGVAVLEPRGRLRLHGRLAGPPLALALSRRSCRAESRSRVREPRPVCPTAHPGVALRGALSTARRHDDRERLAVRRSAIALLVGNVGRPSSRPRRHNAWAQRQIVATVLAAAVTVVAVVAGGARGAADHRGDPARAARPGALRRQGRPHEDHAGRDRSGHTRMLKWSVVGAAHWFVMVGVRRAVPAGARGVLRGRRPRRRAAAHRRTGRSTGWSPSASACSAWLGILVLIVDPAAQPARRARRAVPVHRLDDVAGLLRRVRSSSRVLICGFLIRGFKVATGDFDVPGLGHAGQPRARRGPAGRATTAITLVALVKIVISMTWLIVIALNVTMGVAWHRFLAFLNIFFKRDRPAGRLRRSARCGR